MNFIGNFVKHGKTPNLSSYVISGECCRKYLSPSTTSPWLFLPQSRRAVQDLKAQKKLEVILGLRQATRATLRLEKNSDSVSLRGWTSDTVRQTWVLWKARTSYTHCTHIHTTRTPTHTHTRVHRQQKSSHLSLHKESSIGIFYC